MTLLIVVLIVCAILWEETGKTKKGRKNPW
jgi:hypothetical protein